MKFSNGVVPRDEAFSLYWHFAAERQSVFYKRLSGQTAPWTNDSILSTYKFCNVFRITDRVSQYLVNDVIYNSNEYSPVDTLFRTIVFRFFSNPETWEAIEQEFGGLSTSNYSPDQLKDLLDARRESGKKLYTGAFILCANRAFGPNIKHYNHAALFSMLVKDDSKILRALLAADSLESVYRQLLALPLIGKFMAYQIAIDLNYSPHINFSESDFVAAGPGAARGIQKCFSSKGNLTDEKIIQWVQENQVELARHYGQVAPTLFGRPMQSIDCQGLFCETDKYCRKALPELTSARSRIKSVFKPMPSIEPIFLPPKWGIDISLPPISLVTG